MMKHKIITILFAVFAFFTTAHAQTDNDVTAKDFSKNAADAEFLKSGDKMYAVIVVIAIILVGLFVYLYRLDKKIDKYKKLQH